MMDNGFWDYNKNDVFNDTIDSILVVKSRSRKLIEPYLKTFAKYFYKSICMFNFPNYVASFQLSSSLMTWFAYITKGQCYIAMNCCFVHC